MVAGMTGSGKTVWVKNLLEYAAIVINPSPQRIAI
jgi:DNA helicase HerA-like ATPase